jgi:DNA-binding XRE family transcriptional regulator
MKKKLNIKSDPDLEKIHQRIIMLRETKKQGSAAKAVGMSRSNLKKIEDGEGLPSIPTLIKICRHFNVSSDSILFGINKFPEGIKEENGGYEYEEKLLVPVPSEKMIKPLKVIGKAYERANENHKGWIVTELEKLADEAQKLIK